MKDKSTIIVNAKQTILAESKAISQMAELVDMNFENAINCIYNSKGRVIITGIGKSANIATKIVATFNSTGTPAVFMHAADAIHGDLGNVQKEDIVIWPHRVSKEKGIDDLIQIANQMPNKRFVITSSGNKEIDIDLPKNIEYINNLSKSEYYSWLSKSKYYLS